MKKKLSILLMCAILAVAALMMFSCGLETQSQYSVLAPEEAADGYATLKKTYSISKDESVVTLGNSFFYTTNVSKNADNKVVSTTYALYSYKAGKIASETVKAADGRTAGDIANVYVYSNGNVAFFAKTFVKESLSQKFDNTTGKYKWETSYTSDPTNSKATAYDVYGNAFLEFAPEFDVNSGDSFASMFQNTSSVGDDTYMFYDKKIYKCDKYGKIELYKDTTASGIDVVALKNNGTLEETTDGYVSIQSISGGKCFIFFDKDFKLLNTIEYDYTEDVKVSTYVLANGNILIERRTELGNTDEGDRKEYGDETGNVIGTAYDYEIYNVAENDFDSVSFGDYMIDNVTVIKADNKKVDATKVTNLVTAYDLDDGFKYSKPYTFAMDNNGEFLFEIDIKREVKSAKMISSDVVLVKLPYATQLVKAADGTVIATIDSDYEYMTANYFVYDDKIVDFNGQTAFEIPKAYTIIGATEDADIVAFSTVGAKGTEYYIWKDGTNSKIENCSGLTLGSFYYKTVVDTKKVDENTAYESVNYSTTTYYSLDGKVLFSYANNAPDATTTVEVQVKGDVIIQKVTTNGTENTTTNIYFVK